MPSGAPSASSGVVVGGGGGRQVGALDSREVGGIEVHLVRHKRHLVAGLSRCGVLVAGDTGPLHLAAALGARVVGLFGSTPVNTGFWTWEEQGTLLRAEGLACSPCSMHGRRRCPRGHHPSMEDLVEMIEESGVMEDKELAAQLHFVVSYFIRVTSKQMKK